MLVKLGEHSNALALSKRLKGNGEGKGGQRESRKPWCPQEALTLSVLMQNWTALVTWEWFSWMLKVPRLHWLPHSVLTSVELYQRTGAPGVATRRGYSCDHITQGHHRSPAQFSICLPPPISCSSPLMPRMEHSLSVPCGGRNGWVKTMTLKKSWPQENVEKLYTFLYNFKLTSPNFYHEFKYLLRI